MLAAKPQPPTQPQPHFPAPKPQLADVPVTRCLSIRRPWAPLIIQGYKSIENRSWPTSYRGRIAIHASQADETHAYDRWLNCGSADDETHGPILCGSAQLAAFREYMNGRYGPLNHELHAGPGIIGTAELINCIDMSGDDADALLPDDSPGYSTPPWCWYSGHAGYAWIFANPISFITEPIDCHGKLNLWKLDRSLMDQVMIAERRAIEATDWTK